MACIGSRPLSQFIFELYSVGCAFTRLRSQSLYFWIRRDFAEVLEFVFVGGFHVLAHFSD